MVIKYNVKSDLEIGHVIRITFDRKEGLVIFYESNTLLWESGYPKFHQMSYDFMRSTIQPFEIKEMWEALDSTGVVYGCVLEPAHQDGMVSITFHPDPNILHQMAKVILEPQQVLLETIKERIMGKRKEQRKTGYSFSWHQCDCRATLEFGDPICPDCTDFKCIVCGRCKCNEREKLQG
ncbi:hypothetical protein [Brevibacillus sp. H7]|uniref:hypothetical protein n=1 Tax=Brevibacillus sp. H7 TaxID=3349138 RepID=UPI0037FD8200